MSGYRNKRILDLAQHHHCQALGCPADAPSVAAHSNFGKHGKGTSMKAHDCFVAYLCVDCHRWVDQGMASQTDKEEVWYGAHESSIPLFSHLLNAEGRALLAADRP